VANNGNTHSFQIPSDIKPGTYVMRTELLALHGNALSPMKQSLVSGPESYPYCFNIEITGSGTATPDAITFPDGYRKGDVGLSFAPHYGAGSGVEHNSKYVSNSQSSL
jgi:cellulase